MEEGGLAGVGRLGAQDVGQFVPGEDGVQILPAVGFEDGRFP